MLDLQSDEFRRLYGVNSAVCFVLGLALNAALLNQILALRRGGATKASPLRAYSRILVQTALLDIAYACVFVAVQPVSVWMGFCRNSSRELRPLKLYITTVLAVIPKILYPIQ